MGIFKDVKTNIDYLFPKSIRDYLPEDNEAWMFNDITNGIDITNITNQYSSGGKQANNPLAMIKSILYSYYNNIKTSRKIQKAMQEHIPYKIFSGDEVFNFRRICEFRVRFKKELAEIFVKVLITAGKFKMLDLEALFTDGSFIKANASVKHCYKKEELKKHQKKLKKSIKEKLEKCIKEDEEEDEKYGMENNPYILSKEYKDKEKRLKKINEALKEIEENGEDEINLTDKDAKKMKQKDGSYKASYNLQMTVSKNQFIISNDVTQNKHDSGAEEKVEAEARKNIKKIKEETGNKIPKGKIPLVKDSGYYRINDLEGYKKDKDFDYHVIEQKEISKEEKTEDGKLKKAVYDKKKNAFKCIAGKEIRHQKTYKDKRYGYVHKYSDKEKCIGCKLKHKCIKGKMEYKQFQLHGDLKLRNEMRKKVESKEGKVLMKQRGQSVEPVYGDIKWNNNFISFLLRGLGKVRLEFSIECTVHNIKLIINKIKQENIKYKEILGIT